MSQPTLFDHDLEPAPSEAAPEPARTGKAKKVAPPLREPFAEPHTSGFAGFPIREEIAAQLTEIASDYEAGTCSADELFRHLRGCLYCLTPTESLRVGKGIAELIRGTDERLQVGRPRSADATGAKEVLRQADELGADGINGPGT